MELQATSGGNPVWETMLHKGPSMQKMLLKQGFSIGVPQMEIHDKFHRKSIQSLLFCGEKRFWASAKIWPPGVYFNNVFLVALPSSQETQLQSIEEGLGINTLWQVHWPDIHPPQCLWQNPWGLHTDPWLRNPDFLFFFFFQQAAEADACPGMWVNPNFIIVILP